MLVQVIQFSLVELVLQLVVILKITHLISRHQFLVFQLMLVDMKIMSGLGEITTTTVTWTCSYLVETLLVFGHKQVQEFIQMQTIME